MTRPVSILLLYLLLFASCRRYHAEVVVFHTLPSDGWEQTDTIRFPIDTLDAQGTYQLSIGLRTSISSPYPFRNLQLNIQEKISSLPQRSHTISIPISTNHHGTTLKEYLLPVDTIQLPPKATGEILITHHMRNNPLYGIRDLGVKLIEIK